MNIFSFLIGKDQDYNLPFINGLLSNVSFSYSQELPLKLLELIEATVKERLINIILYEKEIAIQADLCQNDDDFIEIVSNDPEWQEYFFEQYPVLKDYLYTAYGNIRKLLEDIINRLNSDFVELYFTNKHILDSIEIGEGDFHDGKCTCKLSFSNGTYIFYKPRSLKIDIEILQFFIGFQKSIGRDFFYQVKNIDKGIYGWSEAVNIIECSSENEVKNHYEGMGVLTALTHALKIEDIIKDNIISTGGRIALIDLECSLGARLDLNIDALYKFNNLAGEIYRNSVINTGIIPRYTYKSLKEDGESDGSLSSVYSRRNNEYEKGINKQIHLSENHIPKLFGKSNFISEYFNDYLNGFNIGYDAIVNQNNDFIQFVLKLESREIETRVIYRATKVYSAFINQVFNSKYLKSFEHRDNLLNRLFKSEYTGFPYEVIKSEIQQLKAYNIPAFKKKIGINLIHTFSGISLNIPYSNKSDIDQVIARIETLGAEDYNIQFKIIIQSLKIFEGVNYREPIPEFTLVNNISIYQNHSVENLIHGLLDFIYNQLYIDYHSVSILDTYHNAKEMMAIGPIGSGLAVGTDGLALIFAFYGKMFNQYKYTEIAKKIVSNNAIQFSAFANDDRNVKIIPEFTFSSFHAPGSILYASKVLEFLNLGFCTSDQFDEDIYQYYKKWIYKDDKFDYLLGSCGAIFLFYQLYQKNQDNRYKEIISLCAETLIQNVIHISEDKVCWSSEKFINLGGFSHGTSSYCVALLYAYDSLKIQQYYDMFEKALNYDHSLFSKEYNQYSDMRFYPEFQSGHAWAHGSAGIGLSRLMISEILPNYPGISDEINVCRMNTDIDLLSVREFDINSGFAGNLEALMAMNNYCGISNEYVNEIVQNKVNSYLMNPNSLATIDNHVHLFFNIGISGLAYSLLKYLDPSSIPSMIIMSTNTRFGTKYLYDK